MKSLVFLLILFFVLQVSGAQKKPDYIYKAAAQICKPYFLQCRQNPDRKISDCFQGVYKSCLPTFREAFQSIEKCAVQAGDDLQSVLNCHRGFTEA